MAFADAEHVCIRKSMEWQRERNGDLSGTKKKRYGSDNIYASYGSSNCVGGNSVKCNES